MYACMYVCVCVCMYVCMYACMYDVHCTVWLQIHVCRAALRMMQQKPHHKYAAVHRIFSCALFTCDQHSTTDRGSII